MAGGGGIYILYILKSNNSGKKSGLIHVRNRQGYYRYSNECGYNFDVLF